MDIVDGWRYQSEKILCYTIKVKIKQKICHYNLI